MIITCPNCQTRYQVANDQVTATGRQVLCATCSTAWLATPSFPKPASPDLDPEPSDDELIFRADKDTLFTQADETLLDYAFAREEARDAEPTELDRDEEQEATEREALQAIEQTAQQTDEADDAGQTIPRPFAPAPAKRKKKGTSVQDARKKAIVKRRNAMISSLPIARIRRGARFAIGLALVMAVAAAISMRTEIVRAAPEFDGLFSLMGLGTNVIGLEFTDVKTLRTTRDGNGVIIVTAKISNITNRVAYVPSVLVSLIDADDRVIYEWSVTPAARNILPGDILGIDTQLTAPPQGVERVRLSFIEGQNRTAASGTH